jgi:hypothetical protein
MLTWVWALSPPPFPPVCPEVPFVTDQHFHLLHQWKVLPLMFCFVSGSPDFGSISFQLFWICPFPACILFVLLVAVALAFVSFQLGALSFPMSHFSTVETRFILLLWVSGLLHKCHDLGLGCLGRGFVSSKLGRRGILRRHPFLLFCSTD